MRKNKFCDFLNIQVLIESTQIKKNEATLTFSKFSRFPKKKNNLSN